MSASPYRAGSLAAPRVPRRASRWRLLRAWLRGTFRRVREREDRALIRVGDRWVRVVRTSHVALPENVKGFLIAVGLGSGAAYVLVSEIARTALAFLSFRGW